MDFADASLIILAESLGYGRIGATDRRDFHADRWKNHHPFHKASRIRPGWTRRRGMFGVFIQREFPQVDGSTSPAR